MRHLAASLGTVALACASLHPAFSAGPLEELTARMGPGARGKLAIPVEKLDPRGHELARAFLAPLAPGASAATAEQRDRARGSAASLMQDRISLLHGYPPQDLGFPYDWFRAPKDDLQWPTHLSRHYYLMPVAEAYRATGDRQYADHLVAVLLDWVRAFPLGRPGLPWRWKTPPGGSQPPSGEAGFPQYSDGPWTSLSAHARTDTWLRLLPLVAASEALDNQATAIFLNSLLGDHRRVMIDFPRSGTANQFLAIGASLINLSFALPGFEGADEARRIGLERVTEFARKQVYEDGSVAECSPNYGLGSLTRLDLLNRDLAARGIEPPAILADRLRKAVRYYAFTSDPNGRSPRIAKGGGEIVRQLVDLNRAARDPEVAWITSRGREGTQPSALNFAFDWAGHFVFRTGWKPEDAWLFFDAGPRGSGHHDRAQLGIQAAVGGTAVLVDPGYYSYSTAGEEGQMSRFLNSTHAHNTAIVDGEGQLSVAQGQPRGANAAKEDYRWNGRSAEGAYTYGYGDKGQIRVVHHRRVSMAKGPGEFTVEDWFTGEGRHRYEVLWQAPPKAEVKIEGRSAVIRTPHATATLTWESEAKLEAATVPGWYSETYGKLEPATTIKVSTDGPSPAIRTTVRLAAQR